MPNSQPGNSPAAFGVPSSSEEGKLQNVLWTLTGKPMPESGRDCPMCAELDASERSMDSDLKANAGIWS